MTKRFSLELELETYDDDEAKDIIEGLADHARHIPGVEDVEIKEHEEG